MAHISSRSQADAETEASDLFSADGRMHEAREALHVAWKPGPPVIGKPSQGDKDTMLSVEASRISAAAIPVYGAAPVHP